MVAACVFHTDQVHAAQQDPETDYWLQCAGCHMFDGRGLPPDIPTLIDQPGNMEALRGGREYLIRIPGVAQAALDDTRLAEVLNYMLLTFSADTLSSGFRPFTSREVSRHRSEVLIDPLKRRAEILAASGDFGDSGGE